MRLFALFSIVSLALSSTALAKDFICVTESTQKLFSIKFDSAKKKVLALESEDQTFAPGTVQLEITEETVHVDMNRGRSGVAKVSAVKESPASPLYLGEAYIRGFDTRKINTNNTESIRCQWDSIPSIGGDRDDSSPAYPHALSCIPYELKSDIKCIKLLMDKGNFYKPGTHDGIIQILSKTSSEAPASIQMARNGIKSFETLTGSTQVLIEYKNPQTLPGRSVTDGWIVDILTRTGKSMPQAGKVRCGSPTHPEIAQLCQ